MSLQVWLPLIGDLHNQGLADIDMSLVSGNTFITTDSKIGHGSLKLTKRQLISSTAFNGKKQISWALWVKVNTAWSAQWLDGIYWVTSDGSTTDSNRQEFYTNCTKVGMWYKGGSISGYNFTPGVWTHLAGTVDYENGQAAFYINGIQQGSTTNNVDTTRYITSVYIGDSGIDVQENDVRIYDHILSKKEIEEISKGLVLHYKLDGSEFKNPNLLLDTNVSSLTKVKAPNNRYYESSSSGTYTAVFELINDPPAANIKYGVHYTVTSASGFHSLTWYSGGTISVTNEPYTMSCYVKKISTENMSIKFQYGKSPYISKIINLINDNEWHQYSWTFTPDTASGKAAASGTTRIYAGGPSTVGEVIICGWKLEKGDCVTPWCESENEGFEPSLIIYDSSGYNNNGTIIGEIELNNNSPRYTVATYINSPDPTTNSATGEYYISADCGLVTPTEISIAWWANPESGYGGNISHAMWSTTANDVASDYQVSAFNHRDTGFDVNSSDGVHLRLSTSSFVKNEWHHYVVTYDGQTAKLYKDGIQQTSVAFTAAKTLGTFTKILIGHSRAGGVHRKMKGIYSDFRVYATALTEDQILELYHTSATIDNNGNVYAREVVE